MLDSLVPAAVLRVLVLPASRIDAGMVADIMWGADRLDIHHDFVSSMPIRLQGDASILDLDLGQAAQVAYPIPVLDEDGIHPFHQNS